MTQEVRQMIPPRSIDDGDVGVVITSDKKFFVFNAHSVFDPTSLSETQLEQGRILEALTLAIRFPQVMDVLKRMANDPAIVSQAPAVVQ